MESIKQSKKLNLEESQVSTDTRWYFDGDAADAVVRFFETELTHLKGQWAGKPIKLMGFQKRLLGDLFGWKDKETGYRKYTEAYIKVPRKNGKTLLAAGIAHYMLLEDEPGAEIYFAAGDKEQAKVCFNMAKGMVVNNEDMAAAYAIYRDHIFRPKNDGIMRVLSADADTKHGFNASANIIDEYHVHPTSELKDVLMTSMGTRRQPLSIVITTAGYDTSSPCYKEEQKAKKILAERAKGNDIEPWYYVSIYEAEEHDDPFSEVTWMKANPGYGEIVKKEYIQKEATKAKNEPSYLNTFKRLHLNIWTSAETVFIPPHVWRACDLNRDTDRLERRPCIAALDLASVRDLVALALFFPGEEYHDLVLYHWCPKDKAMDRKMKNEADYVTWAEQGHIKITEGATHDYADVRRVVNELAVKYDLKYLAYDRWNSSQLIKELELDGIKCEPYGQGYSSMSAPTKQVEAWVYQKVINHFGNPVLEWEMGNVMLTQDPAGNVKPDKAKSKDKIDGVIATVMAIGTWINHADELPSVYNDRGLIFI